MSNMAGSSTGTWIKFFNEAGIPPDVAATYALTFSDNRIKMDMLLDLTKEILRDMGITLMGDVIAILKHAKQVHEQKARDTILLEAPQVPPPKKMPVARVVEQYGKSTPEVPKTVPAKLSPSLAKRLGPLSSGKPTKTKCQPTEAMKKDEKAASAAVKKPRQVLPEHEGKYKVIMPSGSTPKTKRILEKQGLLPAKKRTVFERLGDGSVSSTTEIEEPKFTVTCGGETLIKSDSMEKVVSVFNRLGDKPQVTSTSYSIISQQELDEPLEYVGVLKQSVVRKTEVKKSDTRFVALYQGEEPNPSPAVGTMRADEVKTVKKGVVNRLGQQKKLDVPNGALRKVATASRPGILKKKVIMKKAARSNSAGILSNPTNAVKLNVKERLGNTGTESSDVAKPKKVIIKKQKISVVPSDTSKMTEKEEIVHKVPEQRVVFAAPATQQNKLRHSPVTFSNTPSGSITLRTGVFSRLGT